MQMPLNRGVVYFRVCDFFCVHTWDSSIEGLHVSVLCHILWHHTPCKVSLTPE